MDADRENKKFNENVYKIVQIKISIFPHFPFCKKYIFDHQGSLLVFDLIIKFNY